jgi:protein-disulfide isomerase
VYQVKRPKGVSIPANVTVLAADTAGFRGYVIGSDSAKVEISEYADYQCPFCADFATIQFPAIRQQLIQTGLVRWRFRDFPLNMHPNSRVAAHAAACADEQGKFWDMHVALFDHQTEWAPQKNASSRFSTYAEQIGLDVTKYNACMGSAKYAGRIQASLDEGTKLGVNGTPTFLIGGRLYTDRASNSDSIRALVMNLMPKAGTPQ